MSPKQISTYEPETQELPRGCRRMAKGCAQLLLALYGLQCLAGAAAIWHRHECRTLGQYQLTLYYPTAEKISMFVPGIGGLFGLIHWVTWGNEQELIKAVDITLPDGRKHTLQGEDFTSLDKLGICETPAGIQLTNVQGEPWVDTAPIPLSSFHKETP